jgi:Uma2 family endonuclease
VVADPAQRHSLTYGEYREIERVSPVKHEFANGETYAMSGAKASHNRVAANLVTELSSALREQPCLVYTSDMRVLTADETATYPDVSALCGEPRFLDNSEEDLLNPTFVAEVLSPSTEAYDRGDKFAHYRTLPSLQDFLLASSSRPELELYSREADGWKLRTFGPGQVLELRSLGCSIEVNEVYRKVFRSQETHSGSSQ